MCLSRHARNAQQHAQQHNSLGKTALHAMPALAMWLLSPAQSVSNYAKSCKKHTLQKQNETYRSVTSNYACEAGCCPYLPQTRGVLHTGWLIAQNPQRRTHSMQVRRGHEQAAGRTTAAPSALHIQTCTERQLAALTRAMRQLKQTPIARPMRKGSSSAAAAANKGLQGPGMKQPRLT